MWLRRGIGGLLFIYLFNDTFNRSNYNVSNGRVVSGQRIAESVAGSDSALI
jgi:hypothetical protein